MQSSSEQPLVGEERYVTTLITAAKETPGGVLPYLGYTGTCRWIGYGFLASLS